MSAIKGPGIFLAQFASSVDPKCNLRRIAGWTSDLGYKGVQIPSFDPRLFDLEKAAASQAYCGEIKGTCREA